MVEAAAATAEVDAAVARRRAALPRRPVVCHQTRHPQAHRTTQRKNAHTHRSLLLQHACLEGGGPFPAAYPVVRVGCSLLSRAWGSLPLHPARSCCLTGLLPPQGHAFHEADSDAFLYEFPRAHEAPCGDG